MRSPTNAIESQLHLVGAAGKTCSPTGGDLTLPTPALSQPSAIRRFGVIEATRRPKGSKNLAGANVEGMTNDYHR